MSVLEQVVTAHRIGMAKFAALDGRGWMAFQPERPPVSPPAGLTVRTLDPHEGVRHAKVAAPAFGAPPELILELASPAFLTGPGIRCLVGELDGEPVSTAICDVNGDVAGIFSVATSAQHRGRGCGAALTAAAVQCAFDTGARVAFLLSAPLAIPVCERLGFRELERRSMWVGGLPAA